MTSLSFSLSLRPTSQRQLESNQIFFFRAERSKHNNVSCLGVELPLVALGLHPESKFTPLGVFL